ncbi:MAG: hypothetical protein IJU18_07490 [Oscillospiraceae bacterium]|nr:hypothetical protein [Oscillospiraceae bacterium]
MQKRWTAFALATLLALGATGCAAGNNPDRARPLFPDDAITGGNHDSFADNGISGTSDRSAADGEDFETMLENGRVRDRDGDLRNHW